MALRTAHKILLARILYHVLRFIRRLSGRVDDRVMVNRSGVNWNLDLKEGIDLSIYLFGYFEPELIELFGGYVKEGAVVLDIGANIGAHTLPLAGKVGDSGKVYAFEPTQFAFQKLKENISLNPFLSGRISAEQIMLVSGDLDALEPEIFSSWPLSGPRDDLHEKHRGRLMSTTGAAVLTLDAWAKRAGIQRLDLIKIDVDGHEYAVLSGGTSLLTTYKPVIIMEMAPYVFQNPGDFDRLIRFLQDLHYQIFDAHTQKRVPPDPSKIRGLIPEGRSRNVVIKPS